MFLQDVTRSIYGPSMALLYISHMYPNICQLNRAPSNFTSLLEKTWLAKTKHWSARKPAILTARSSVQRPTNVLNTSSSPLSLMAMWGFLFQNCISSMAMQVYWLFRDVLVKLLIFFRYSLLKKKVMLIYCNILYYMSNSNLNSDS